MAQMGAAVLAGDFDAAHAVAGVFLPVKAVGIERVPETRPTAAGVEFLIGREQWMAAADAVIDAVGRAIGIFTGEGRLRAFFAADMELFGGQLLPPALFGVVFGAHRGFIEVGQ